MKKLQGWIDSGQNDHSFNKDLLGTHYEPNAVGGPGNTAMSKWDKISASVGHIFQHLASSVVATEQQTRSLGPLWIEQET